MAVWGIGAKFNNSDTDLMPDFLNREIAYVGYNRETASDIFRVLDSIKKGDLIYIKSTYKDILYIKAIGIVKNDNIEAFSAFENPNDNVYGMKVKWLIELSKCEKFPFCKDYHYNVFKNTVYEELNDDVLDFITTQIANKFE